MRFLRTRVVPVAVSLGAGLLLWLAVGLFRILGGLFPPIQNRVSVAAVFGVGYRRSHILFFKDMNSTVPVGMEPAASSEGKFPCGEWRLSCLVRLWDSRGM